MTCNLSIAIIVPRASGIGGIAQHTRKLAEWLNRKGCHARLITVPHIHISGLANPTAIATMTLRLLFEKLTGKLRENIVHVHHILYFLPATITGKPIILTLHGDARKQYYMLRPKAKAVVEIVERIAVTNAEIVTAISPIIAKTYMKRYNKKIIYIPNAIDPNDIPQEPLEKEENTVVYVGRLSYEKGIDILLEAAKILERIAPQIKIKIIGKGPLQFQVQKHAQKLKNLQYLGYKPRQEALKEMKKAEVLILPSRAEGFPTVILEAALTKTAIIASKIPEITSLFKDDEIFFVDTLPKTLANAINRVVTDEKLKKKLIENIYTTVKKKYNWSNIINKYIEVYKLLVN